MDWRFDAACRRENPELFFPVGSDGPAQRQAAAAKAVCRRCPVREHCLAYALAEGEDPGVWGGTDETERRVLRHAGRRMATTA